MPISSERLEIYDELSKNPQLTVVAMDSDHVQELLAAREALQKIRVVAHRQYVPRAITKILYELQAKLDKPATMR